MCDDFVSLMEPAEVGDAPCLRSRESTVDHKTSDSPPDQKMIFAQQVQTLPLDVQIGLVLIGERGRRLLLQRLSVMRQRRSNPFGGADA